MKRETVLQRAIKRTGHFRLRAYLPHAVTMDASRNEHNHDSVAEHSAQSSARRPNDEPHYPLQRAIKRHCYTANNLRYPGVGHDGPDIHLKHNIHMQGLA